MTQNRTPFLRRFTLALVVCGAAAGVFCSSADARVFVGVGVAPFFPGYYPPPVYYPPPPVYYAPPPVVYAPPQTYTPAPPAQGYGQAGSGQACYAGPYVCPMDHPVSAGSSCYCLGNGGQRVWGRAN